MEGLGSFTELFQLQAVEWTFRCEVWLDFERAVPLEAVLRPLSGYRHVLSVGTVADEKGVPGSGVFLSSTKFITTLQVRCACPTLFQVDGVGGRELQRPDVTARTAPEEAPAPSADETGHPLCESHSAFSVVRCSERDFELVRLGDGGRNETFESLKITLVEGTKDILDLGVVLTLLSSCNSIQVGEHSGDSPKLVVGNVPLRNTLHNLSCLAVGESEVARESWHFTAMLVARVVVVRRRKSLAGPSEVFTFQRED